MSVFLAQLSGNNNWKTCKWEELNCDLYCIENRLSGPPLTRCWLWCLFVCANQKRRKNERFSCFQPEMWAHVSFTQNCILKMRCLSVDVVWVRSGDKEHSYSHKCPHGHNAFSTFQWHDILSYCANQQGNLTTQHQISREKIKQIDSEKLWMLYMRHAVHLIFLMCSINTEYLILRVVIFSTYYVLSELSVTSVSLCLSVGFHFSICIILEHS